MALDLEDKSTNSNTLTNNGAADGTADTPFAASGHVAVLVAAQSDYFSAADSVSLSITGDMTIECWANFTSEPGSGLRVYFVSKRGPTVDANRSYRFAYFNDSGTNKLELRVNDGSGGTSVFVDWDASTSTWYHLAVAYDASAGTADFYVNGSQQGTQQSGLKTSINDSGTELQIGAQEANNFFDGLIDEVRLWNDIRTSSEIDDNKAVELTGAEGNLAAYYPFEALGAVGPAGVKTIDGTAIADIKSINGTLTASVKTISGSTA